MFAIAWRLALALTVSAVATFGLAGYIGWGQGEEMGCIQGYESECMGYGGIFEGFVQP